MKLDIKKNQAKALVLLKRTSKYAGFIATIIFLLIYIFLALKIKTNIQKTPDDDQVLEKLSHTNLPRIDQNSINKINELKDQNIQVKSLFKKARSNPFSE